MGNPAQRRLFFRPA